MKILVVDDEQKIANVLAERLKLRGFDATAVFDGTSALSLLRRETFDGIILDLRLPDIDGIEVLTETKGAFPDMKVDLGAVACFHKPAKISKLAEALTFPQVKRDESD
jgi:DNA-binding response OmpR family regulator